MDKKLIILLTVFIDVLGIGIIIPILPFYVESFGASAFTVTLLFTVFSFFAFFSGPLLGAWSDKIGRRPVLIISILSTAIGWVVFAAAKNISWLFLGRIIDGLAAGNFPIAQSYLIDIAKDEKEKTSNLGLIGAIFGVGLIIGPVIGGVLSQISLDFPFWIVGGLSFFNFILALTRLPETNQNKDSQKKIDLNPFRPLWRSLKNPKLRLGFAAWFLFGLAFASQQSVFSLYLSEEFNFNSLIISLFTAGSGIILIINQGFALKKFWLKHFSASSLSVWLSLALGVGFLMMGVVYLIVFLIGLVLMSFAQSILRATMTSQITKRNGSGGHGAILGVLNSVMSLSMIIGPILAGWFFGLKSNLPFIFSGLAGLVAFILLLIDSRNKCDGEEVPELARILEEQKMELA